MKTYKYYQPNKKDLKDEQGDCAIRALSKFLGITWLEAFDLLVGYARETQKMINNMENMKLCLEDLGISYVSVYKPKEKKKTTVSSFVKSHKSDTFILYVRSGYGTYLVCCQDGKYFDTWDCGDCIVYGYFEKRKEVEPCADI